ncbi:hypothetical protein GCM10010293_47130 [Streptomyces griseoflavus]|nr:hypothetical protein GCM10010293_47130 [Streptomyces griseoflavus]
MRGEFTVPRELSAAAGPVGRAAACAAGSGRARGRPFRRGRPGRRRVGTWRRLRPGVPLGGGGTRVGVHQPLSLLVHAVRFGRGRAGQALAVAPAAAAGGPFSG